jgi:hypothetical protein
LKKNFVIAIVILIVLVLFWSNVAKKSIPSLPPNIIITSNQNKIETAQGDYNWFDNEMGGNSSLADTPNNLLKNLTTTNVEKGQEIKFSFDTSWKQPNKTILYLVKSDINNPYILEEQIMNSNSFKAPIEKGEYNFIIYSSWDEGHSVSNVFKINVI